MQRLGGSAHAATRTPRPTSCSTYLRAVCHARRQALDDERVIVFTEYRDTQNWLLELLAAGRARRRPASRCSTAAWTTTTASSSRPAFQADPTEHPVRILLATDAASEGIDLQNHCHRLVHYDIPLNPNRLEQRNGRIDRYGQTARPEVCHFVGAGWRATPSTPSRPTWSS